MARAKFFNSPITAAILVVVALISIRSVWQIYSRARLAGQLRDQATSELEADEERQRQLMAEIATLKTERGVEASIRGKFSVVKEGEKVITVVSNPTTTATSTKPWWKFWKW